MELTISATCVILLDAYLTSVCHSLKTPFQAFLEENHRVLFFTHG